MIRTDEEALTRAIIALASKYGRYCYRRITTLLREAGWRDSGKHSLGQRPGEFVARELSKWLGNLGTGTLYIDPGSPGKRLLRELQRKAAGPVPEWRDLLVTEGGTDHNRKVAGSVQHQAAAFLARLPAARPGGR